MNEKIEAQLRLDTVEQLFSIIPPETREQRLVPLTTLSIDFIDSLVNSEHYNDAIRYLAIALPRRAAIWWACATHRSQNTERINNQDEARAWELVEEWVYNPCEENRVQTQAIAEKLNYETAGSYGAIGVFWSGGSIVPAETGQIVPPGAHLTGTAVAASIIISCSKGELGHLSARQKQALVIGMDIAYGGNGINKILAPS
jgi:hypothetical protein